MPTWDAQSCRNRLAHCYYGMKFGQSEAYDFARTIREEVYRNTLAIVARGRYVGGEHPNTCPVRLPDDAAMRAGNGVCKQADFGRGSACTLYAYLLQCGK